MSKFWEEYKGEIVQRILLLFSAIMLVYGVMRIGDEYKGTKENYNKQLIEINIKLEEIEKGLNDLKLQGGD